MKLKNKPKWFRRIYPYRGYAYLFLLVLVIFLIVFGVRSCSAHKNDPVMPVNTVFVPSEEPTVSEEPPEESSEPPVSSEMPVSSESPVPSEALPVPTESDGLVGTFSFGEYATYVFDGKGCGTLTVNRTTTYDFCYRVDGDRLSLEYTDSSADWSNYRWALSGDRLMLIGIDGTAGRFDLTRQPN